MRLSLVFSPIRPARFFQWICRPEHNGIGFKTQPMRLPDFRFQIFGAAISQKKYDLQARSLRAGGLFRGGIWESSADFGLKRSIFTQKRSKQQRPEENSGPRMVFRSLRRADEILPFV